MPQRNSSSRRFLTRLVLFSLASYALVALGRRPEAWIADEAESEAVATEAPPKPRRTVQLAETNEWADWDVEVEKAPKPKRRLATTLVFASLFFAGASLTALAGDEVAQVGVDAATATQCDPNSDASAADGCDQSGDARSVDAAPGDSSTEDAPASSTSSDESGISDAAAGSDGSAAPDPSVPADAGSGDAPGADASGPSGGDASGSTAGADSPQGNGGGGGSNAGGGSSSSPGSDPVGSGSGDVAQTDAASSSAPPVLPASSNDSTRPQDPEATDVNMLATVWLHRTLPDPTPPAKRLAPAFARLLTAEARGAKLHWSLLLGVLRAQGHDGRFPARAGDLHRLATQLVALGGRNNGWSAALALSGRTAFADQAEALARYDRAAGLGALVTGLEAAKPALERRVLTDSRLVIYPGGRGDVQAGRVDVRVLVMLEYMAEAYHEVTVSCLVSGHRLYARPGVVSAHVYGLAADISALHNTPIAGNQEQGGLTEHAVRDLLFLPSEMQPQQVISLIGLGGPSFALADHYDHIHVGY
jgi:uncharacterized membrane protein YgcG